MTHLDHHSNTSCTYIHRHFPHKPTHLWHGRWPVKPRWLLESLRQEHSFILLSLNVVQPSPHTLRVDAYGDSMYGETALSSTYAYLAIVKLMLNCVTVSGTPKEMDAIEKAFQYVWNSFDQITPTILRSKVCNRLVDFSEQIGDGEHSWNLARSQLADYVCSY